MVSSSIISCAAFSSPFGDPAHRTPHSGVASQVLETPSWFPSVFRPPFGAWDCSGSFFRFPGPAPLIPALLLRPSRECVVSFGYFLASLSLQRNNILLSNSRLFILSSGRMIRKAALKSSSGGTRVAQPVKCPTLAQAVISRLVDSSPTLGSVLIPQSLEPASDSVSPPLSAPSPLTHCLSLSKIGI